MDHTKWKDRGHTGRRFGPAVIPRALPTLVLAFALGACFDEPTNPAARPGEVGGDARTPSHVLGLVEVTISGIGTGQMTSYAISARNLAELERLRALRETGAHASGKDGNRALRATEASRESGVPAGAADPEARYAFNLPSNSDGSGDGTIQLELASTGSFTHGERGKNGYRYLYATYRVRNARKDGTPYETSRQNLTLVAVKPSDPSKAMGHTPVSQLRRFDGSPADPALAEQLIPTGAAMQTRGAHIEARFPDVLQVFTEEEAAEILGLATAAGMDIDDVFPYGFVVSNAMDDETRELPANPDEDQFDGVVTFAYKVPLQADPADDPFTVRVIFLAVDDGETRITQSLEELTPTAIAAFEARAALLGATGIRLLPWGTTAALSYERFCSVRSAGPASSPTAHVASAPGNLASLSPAPYAGSASSIPATTQFAATFDRRVSGLSPREGLIVHGSQSGRRFVRGTFAGHGTPTITTPVATFFPGEEVEVAIAPSIGRSPCADEDFPTVFRYRVATSPSAGTFTPVNSITPGMSIWSLALGDVDGDGHLDMVAGGYSGRQVLVWRNQGDGTFIATPDAYSNSYNSQISRLALGDLDGDGDLDLIVSTLKSTGDIVVYRNQ